MAKLSLWKIIWNIFLFLNRKFFSYLFFVIFVHHHFLLTNCLLRIRNIFFFLPLVQLSDGISIYPQNIALCLKSNDLNGDIVRICYLKEADDPCNSVRERIETGKSEEIMMLTKLFLLPWDFIPHLSQTENVLLTHKLLLHDECGQWHFGWK